MRESSPLNIAITKEQLLAWAGAFRHEPGTILLFSGGDKDSARHSFLGVFPYQSVSIGHSERPWEDLKEQTSLAPTPAFTDNLPAWMGYVAYEMGLYADEEVRVSGFLPAIPLARFVRPALLLSVDHATGAAALHAASSASQTNLLPSQREAFTRFKNPDAWLSLLHEKHKQEQSPSTLFIPLPPKHNMNSYCSLVERVKESIRAGDVYQVNISQEFCFQSSNSPYFLKAPQDGVQEASPGRGNPGRGDAARGNRGNCCFQSICDPYELFLKAIEKSPAPFAAFMQWGSYAVVCTSPERLIAKHGRLLETRPIKGTVPRGDSQEADEQLRRQLVNSEKERSELLMITDLMRNDLSRIAQASSVKVQELYRVESYASVHHMLSIIQGKAKEGLHPLNLMRSLFPGGSISGCPKLRAMELISEIEKRPRGIYTGSIGYWTDSGDVDFNIAIRTLLVQDGNINLQVGGGIVIDSDPEKEYQETLHKGKILLELLQSEACTSI